MSYLPYDTHWAVTEFADAELGDLRRTQRLVALADVLAQHPTAALPEACGDAAMLKAAYRFFDNDAIEPQDVLLSHLEATYGRLAQVPLVLAAQDTTEVNWTSHKATQGLGPLGHSACQGLMVHSTLAFTPERVLLGLLAQQVWARDPDDVGKRHRRKQLPISQKESQKWLTRLEAVCHARAECPTTHWVSVGDREADVYDVLAAERPEGVELLIRASWDRCVKTPERYVWATVEAQPIVKQLLLQVPRRGDQPYRDIGRSHFCGLHPSASSPGTESGCVPGHDLVFPEITLSRLNDQTRKREKIANGYDGVTIRQLYALAGVPAAGLVEIRMGVV
jgi:hypothetical protein